MSGLFLTGFTNPVLCAKTYLRGMEIPVDEASFDRVAREREGRGVNYGFIVDGYDDLQRLCEVGEFVIAQREGAVVAMLPEEFQA